MATLASFPAREVVVSVLGTIYSMDSGDEAEASDLGRSLRSAVHPDGRRAFGVPVALSIMVFFALCAQCMSTLATVQRETRSWAWTAFAFLYLNLLAYVGALVTFQTATWLGGGH
jgi:ferrous iron transport protein B